MGRTLPVVMFMAALFIAVAAGPLDVAGEFLSATDYGETPVLTKTTTISYTPHAPIVITSDADFASQGWPGSGIVSSPYIIEGLDITDSGVGISITDTAVYFEIRSCLMSSAGPTSSDGLFLERVTHGTIRECLIDQHQIGIHLVSSASCTLSNNTVTGASLSAVHLEISERCSLTGNTLLGSGLLILGYSLSDWLHDSSGNTVNDMPLGYFTNLNDMAVDGSQYGQVFLVNCSYVTLENGVFPGAPFGVEMGYCTNCTLRSNSGLGFFLDTSNGCNLTENTVTSGIWSGLYLYTSDGCTLTNNTATGIPGYAFNLVSSDGCTLTENTATSSLCGFILTDSYSNTLTDCTATYNYDGFALERAGNNTLRSNTATYNYDGFYLTGSDSNTLTGNTATGNSGYGIFTLLSSNDNRIYLNRFGRNSKANAWSAYSSNVWDDGVSSGNYWDDYDGAGTYPIPNSDGDVDHYPFVLDETPPTIDSPADIQYRGTTGDHSIVWDPADLHPDRYELYRNGLLVDTGDWHGSPIIIGVDGLLVGTYNFTLAVYDTCGNWVSDTVLVTVLPPTTTATTTTNVAGIDFPLSALAVVLAAVEATAIVLVFVLLGMGKTARGVAASHGNV